MPQQNAARDNSRRPEQRRRQPAPPDVPPLNIVIDEEPISGRAPADDPSTNVAIGGLIVLLSVLSGPYRVLAGKFRSFGNVRSGVATWAGIVVAYPFFVEAWPPDAGMRSGPVVFWGALVLAGYLQMFVKWCSTSPPLDESVSPAWCGASAEPVFAVIAGFALAKTCCPGTALFFAAGYACSLLQIGLVRARRQLSGWTPEDTQRLLSPARAGAAKTKQATDVLASSALGLARFVAPLAVTIFQVGRSFVGSRAHAAQAAQTGADGQVVYRPPSFANRVGTVVVGHMVLSLITGTVMLKILAIPLAIFLWTLGYKVHMPEEWRQKEGEVKARLEESFERERAEAADRFRAEHDRLAPKVREAAEEAEERAGRAARRSILGF